MKHVNIWYFFITNHVDKGDISLVWCPTGDMIRDFMTKLLQGALFQKVRDQINKPMKGKELKPSRGKSTIYNLVPSKEKGWHHRSVLGEVTQTKDRCLKNLTRTRNI